MRSSVAGEARVRARVASALSEPARPRRRAALLAWTLAVGAAGAAGSVELVRHEIDRRPDGDATAGYVLFSWRLPGGDGSPHALIATSKEKPDGGELDQAFAIWGEGETKRAGRVAGDELAALHAGSANRLLIAVGAEQLAAVAERLTSTGADGTPDEVCDNLVYNLVPTLRLKGPYRGTFGAGDCYVLLRDLTRMNRPKE